MEKPKDEYPEFDNFTDDKTTIEKINRDETEIYRQLIEVKRNIDLFKKMIERTEKKNETLSVLAGLVETEREIQKTSQEIYLKLFDRNINEEEVKRHSRFRSLVGLQIFPDPIEEAAERASLALNRSRGASQESEERILHQLEEVATGLQQEADQISELIENAVENRNDHMFDEIRDQLKDTEK